MKKRYRKVSAKPGELKVSFGLDEEAEGPYLTYAHGGEGATPSDANLLFHAFQFFQVHIGKNLVQELESRGYDIETFRFSIQKQKD